MHPTLTVIFKLAERRTDNYHYQDISIVDDELAVINIKV